eukprot:scaffold140530_cov43-Tisochrysis_lutea.AAC.2
MAIERGRKRGENESEDEERRTRGYQGRPDKREPKDHGRRTGLTPTLYTLTYISSPQRGGGGW